MLPEYGLTHNDRSVGSYAGNASAGVGRCNISPSSGGSGKHATLDERTLPVDCADVSLMDYASKGNMLNGLMWATEQAAEQQYQRIYGKQDLERYYTNNEITKHWIRHIDAAGPLRAMQDPGFQRFYQQICPAQYQAQDQHICLSFVNEKPVPMAATHAEYNFVINAPANIIMVQSAVSPTSIFEGWRAAGTVPAGAQLFKPNHLSDILFHEEKRQRTKHAHRLRWADQGTYGTWKNKLRDLNAVVFMGHSGLSQQTLSVVKQCLVLHTGSQGLPQWPGLVFKAGDHCFAAILGTDPNKAGGWLVASHKSVQEGYGHKMLSKLHVFTTEGHPGGDQSPTFLWRVVDWTPQCEQQARALEAGVRTPPEQPHIP
ncbi:hypothetical protein LTR86_008436 [Recurvomyces mirabilis]|nr:hypothetical protein LTR86_008436 [Recurvomyces mirabilis]